MEEKKIVIARNMRPTKAYSAIFPSGKEFYFSHASKALEFAKLNQKLPGGKRIAIENKIEILPKKPKFHRNWQ
jgi:hypothetical protein